MLPIVPMDCDGLGAFFYPVVLAITEKERLDYSEIGNSDSELSKPPSHKTRKIVLDYSPPSSTKLMVTDDGFIGIFEENVSDVLKILNTIFATGITFGVGSEFVREKDLCRFKVTGDSNHIQLEEIGGPSERNMFHFQRESDSRLVFWRSINTRKVITIEAIKGVLDRSYHYLKVKKSEEVYDDLLLALGGYTLYYRNALRAAYLYGWMIVETAIDRKWKEYLTSLELSGKDKNNLKDSNHWTTHRKTEHFLIQKK